MKASAVRRSSPWRPQPYAHDGYRTLVAAVLQQAVWDARDVRQPATRPQDAGCTNADARDFLRDPERIAFFASLIGCDGDRVYVALRKAAALG
jgi:hypothetical protein